MTRSTDDDGVILIEYAAVENENRGGGWLPAIWVNGRRRGDTWARCGLDKEEAAAAARFDAREEADRYAGDWSITVRERIEVAS